MCFVAGCECGCDGFCVFFFLSYNLFMVLMGFLLVVGMVVMGFVDGYGCCCDGFFFFFFFLQWQLWWWLVVCCKFMIVAGGATLEVVVAIG